MTPPRTNRTTLETFDAKLDVIRDRVRGVARKYHTAAYLVGRPGTSKTFTVRDELERLKVPHVIRSARMTPMGLFHFIAEHPKHVIVLDDIPSLFEQKPALQILMSALDGDPESPRIVTYRSHNKSERVEFHGGIVAISNLPLRHDPLAKSITSRVQHLEHEPTDGEIAAFMGRIADNGYKSLSPGQCHEVVEFIVAETRAHDERLDLRHMSKAFEDRRQWEDGHARTHWQNLVRTNLKRAMRESVETPATKAEDIAQQRDRVREALGLFPDDLVRQLEHTRLKKSTFYSRRKEVLSECKAGNLESTPRFQDSKNPTLYDFDCMHLAWLDRDLPTKAAATMVFGDVDKTYALKCLRRGRRLLDADARQSS